MFKFLKRFVVLVVVNYGRKKCLLLEEKFKFLWKDVFGFVKDLFYIYDFIEKRKEKCLYVFFREKGEVAFLNILFYFFVINREFLFN